MRINTPKIEFSEYDFISLFLANLIKNGVIKIDVSKLGYEMLEFYEDDKYRSLFDMPLKKQIEGSYVDFSGCVQHAILYGLLSSHFIQNSNDRLILLNKEEANDIINSNELKYNIKMQELVVKYLKKIRFKKLNEECNKYPEIQLRTLETTEKVKTIGKKR